MSEPKPLHPSDPSSGPVTTVVTRHVKKGKELEFEEWLEGVAKVSMSFPGHLGIDIFRPPPGETEYTFVYRFDSVEHLRGWTESDERMRWVARGDELCDETPHLQVVHGLEHWFEAPRRHAPGAPPPPPRWKMAVLTFLVIYPTINVVNLALAPLVGKSPPLLRTAVTASLLVPLMTWVLMPLAAKLFVRWLFPGTQKRSA